MNMTVKMGALNSATAISDGGHKACATDTKEIGGPFSRPAQRDPRDLDLWALHDKFTSAYARLLAARTSDADDGSLDTSSPEQKKAYRKWERALLSAEKIARDIVAMPARSVDGMLMKIHISGFNFDSIGKSFSAPYHGMLTASGPQAWRGARRGGAEISLIESIRNDLHRLKEHQHDEDAPLTIERMAGVQFEPWQHDDSEWVPPSTDDEWLEEIQSHHLTTIRIARGVMYKSKPELVQFIRKRRQ